MSTSDQEKAGNFTRLSESLSADEVNLKRIGGHCPMSPY